MRLIEPSKPPKQALLDEVQKSGLVYALLRLGAGLAAVGAIAFALPFLFRSTLTGLGMNWRELQTWGILLVAAGGLLFGLSAAHFKIDISLMTFDRLVAILRNEVYVPPDEHEHVRRHVQSSLGSLDDKWSLYPRVQLGPQGRQLPFVLLGPAGVLGLELNAIDPRKRNYVDPAPELIDSCERLQRRLAANVTPVLLFARHERDYKGSHPRLKAFTSAQLVAWLESRSSTLDGAQRKTTDLELRKLQAVDS